MSHIPPIPTPPVWTELSQHGMLPDTTHDERARFNFLSCLNRHLATAVSPGNRLAYQHRVKPAFEAAQGRSFASREEVHEAMLLDPHFRLWSALRRSTMEMRQQAGRSLCLRQATALAKRAEPYNQMAQDRGTLVLDPQLPIPPYLSAVDHHLMPGSYHTERIAGDVSPGANYDAGLFVTTRGLLGSLNDGGGRAVATWVKHHCPHFQPKRILDIGCGLGHNMLPIAQAFPDAEVIGIDTAAPMLRYGHARAQSLGFDQVRFIQMDAAATSFETESFDWIQSTMFLHETAGQTIHRIFAEIHRLLKPGGLMLHVEQPQYTPDMDLFEQFIRDWDSFYNNEPFWSKMHDIDPAQLMQATGFAPERFLKLEVRATSTVDGTELAEDYGRAPIWHAFGAWK